MSERSTKHSPRVDDELSRETLDEAGEIDPSFTLPHDEVEARAELASALRPAAFPADAISLRRVAEAEGAPDWVFDLLAHVDPVTRYETVGELWRAAGGHVEAGNGRTPQAPARVKDAFIPEPPPVPAPSTPPRDLPAPNRRPAGAGASGGPGVSAAAAPARPGPVTGTNRGARGPVVDLGVALVTWPARTALAVAGRAIDVVRRRLR